MGSPRPSVISLFLSFYHCSYSSTTKTKWTKYGETVPTVRKPAVPKIPLLFWLQVHRFHCPVVQGFISCLRFPIFLPIKLFFLKFVLPTNLRYFKDDFCGLVWRNAWCIPWPFGVCRHLFLYSKAWYNLRTHDCTPAPFFRSHGRTRNYSLFK